MNYGIYEKVFLAILSGYVQRNGIMFADENAFNNVATNVDGLAQAAARTLLRKKAEMQPATTGKVPE